MIGASAVVPLFEGGPAPGGTATELVVRRADVRQLPLDRACGVSGGGGWVGADGGSADAGAAASPGRPEAGKAQALTLQLYVGGLTSYLDVLVAQQTELTALTVQVQVMVSRLQAAVGLIRALGGGWSTSDLPTEERVLPFGPLDVQGQ